MHIYAESSQVHPLQACVICTSSRLTCFLVMRLWPYLQRQTIGSLFILAICELKLWRMDVCDTAV